MPSSSQYSGSTYHSSWKGKDTVWIYCRFQIDAINLIPKKNDDIEKRSFAGGNRSGAGKSCKSFQDTSSKNTISRDSLKSLAQKVTELQKEFRHWEKAI